MSRKWQIRIGLAVMVVAAMVVMPVGRVGADKAKAPAGDGAPAAAGCSGLAYQSDTCKCPQGDEHAKGDKHTACTCKDCSGDKDCACIIAARKVGGSITGEIKVYRTRLKTKGPKGGGEVVVYLEKVGDKAFAASPKPAVLDQKGLVFIPHVLAIQKGSHIEFRNNDNDKHNVYFLYDITGGKTATKDLGTWSPGEMRDHVFKEPKAITVLCKLHLEMAAYIVVLDNPFFTIAKMDEKTQKATFTIKNIPPGQYVLNAWHKKLKLRTGSQKVTVQTGKAASVGLVLTKSKYVIRHKKAETG